MRETIKLASVHVAVSDNVPSSSLYKQQAQKCLS